MIRRHQPADPDYAARVEKSFAAQSIMHRLGAVLERVAPGEVDIRLPYDTALTQQHGFLHAGVVATVLDSACGYAAYSLMPADAGVLSIEFKVNMLAPAQGESLLARGRVERAGRNITVCTGEAIIEDAGATRTVVLMQATMMTVRDRPSVTG